LEQGIRDDLAFGYLAGSATPDFWALHEFCERQKTNFDTHLSPRSGQPRSFAQAEAAGRTAGGLEDSK
jgi:hypothetical protein